MLGDDQAEQLIFHLQGRGYVVRALLEQERTGRIATVRLTRDTEPAVYVDLLFASSGIESEVVADAEEITVLPDLTVRVATQAQDASEDDLRRARAALELIELRGYNRGRSLGDALAHAIADTTG